MRAEGQTLSWWVYVFSHSFWVIFSPKFEKAGLSEICSLINNKLAANKYVICPIHTAHPALKHQDEDGQKASSRGFKTGGMTDRVNFFYTGYAWTKNTITDSSTLSSRQQQRKEPGSLSLLDDIKKSRNLNCRRPHKQGKRPKHPMKDIKNEILVNHKRTELSSELEFMLSAPWKTNTLLL